ncbi:hypothetical protein GCM10007094_24100 [Pseudovibrio japonicus]|uniref:Uncharacterized protein n=1 Tax=Pseudovibrio japonicus TaxID=366534 RepID=A0ABQ3EGR4_9HYPH|nr:hypothetical protein [Pseudovibrio japonicus]GHB34190.1 hypothetical protein GCM10007094_24100 [Pseudovibrio japonicus]
MNIQDKVTVPVAAGALAWPSLHDKIEWLAQESQTILPILGTVWITVQIFAKIYQVWIKKN